jgi:hypothetical protein
MKKFFPLSLLFVLIQYLAFAQPSEGQRERFRERVPAEERAKRQTQLMTDSLALSRSQIMEVNEISLKYIKKREELMGKEMTRQEKMFDLESLEIRQEKEFKKVLNKDQYNQLREMEERRRTMRAKMMQERRKNRGGS